LAIKDDNRRSRLDISKYVFGNRVTDKWGFTTMLYKLHDFE